MPARALAAVHSRSHSVPLNLYVRRARAQPVGHESLVLVERLFADLVTTTESYEALLGHEGEESNANSSTLRKAQNSSVPRAASHTGALP